MKFHLINLNRSPERLAWMQQQLGRLEIDFIRLPAVDGKQLAAEELDRWYAVRCPQFGIGPNEIGAFLSHRAAWQRIVEGGESWAFVGEDDMYVSPDLRKFLADDHWIPNDADIVKAETVKKRVWLAPSAVSSAWGHQLYHLQSYHGGAAGYFIHQYTAQTLLNRTERLCVSPDQALFNPDLSAITGLKLYQLDPALVAQDWVHVTSEHQPKFESSLLNERNKFHCDQLARNRSWSAYLWYKLSNPLFKAGRRGLEVSATTIGTHQVKKVPFADSSYKAA